MNQSEFPCYWVEQNDDQEITTGLRHIQRDALPAGDVLIQTSYSSLNFKDALASTGHQGIVRTLPHIPGIDTVGRVVESSVSEFSPGDRVLATGFDVGAGQWGGWSQYVRLPADWVLPLPEGLTELEAMTIGTAGLTAAQSIAALQRQGVSPDSGEVVVTGSTGGVGCVAICILADLGYHVAAVTGKPNMQSWLQKLGAKRILDRSEVDHSPGKAMLSEKWAGAVDTVGGNTLSTLIRETKLGGCVAACGLVSSPDLPIQVYPFILRGICLAGIDSAWLPKEPRRDYWNQLASEWKPSQLENMRTLISMSQLDHYVQQMLQGDASGRVVVETGG